VITLYSGVLRVQAAQFEQLQAQHEALLKAKATQGMELTRLKQVLATQFNVDFYGLSAQKVEVQQQEQGQQSQLVEVYCLFLSYIIL
jgi:hypothetical protein